MVKEVKILEVHVDKGMKHGQKITFGGEADQAPGVEPGDIVLVLQEKEHEVGGLEPQKNVATLLSPSHNCQQPLHTQIFLQVIIFFFCARGLSACIKMPGKISLWFLGLSTRKAGVWT